MELMMMMMMMMWAFTGLTAAELHCDPVTQYVSNGECCKMCGPGSSMSSLGTCLEPQCEPCDMYEYQDEYTKETLCKRQPYCDRNLNFEVPVHDIKKKSVCKCKVGFHCSTEDCPTCVQHSACGPGFQVQSNGSHGRDTVCEKCPDGTYSDENSVDAVCREWTECGSRQEIQQSGTDVSDSVCVAPSRTHLYVIAVFAVIAVLVLLAAVFYRCRGRRRDAEGKAKSCVESCLGEKGQPQRVLITNPTNPVEEESFLETLSSQEVCTQRTPVEHEDEQSEEMLTADGRLTDNGNLVRQEDGKSDILSQESQLLSFTE